MFTRAPPNRPNPCGFVRCRNAEPCTSIGNALRLRWRISSGTSPIRPGSDELRTVSLMPTFAICEAVSVSAKVLSPASTIRWGHVQGGK